MPCSDPGPVSPSCLTRLYLFGKSLKCDALDHSCRLAEAGKCPFTHFYLPLNLSAGCCRPGSGQGQKLHCPEKEQTRINIYPWLLLLVTPPVLRKRVSLLDLTPAALWRPFLRDTSPRMSMSLRFWWKLFLWFIFLWNLVIEVWSQKLWHS